MFLLFYLTLVSYLILIKVFSIEVERLFSLTFTMIIIFLIYNTNIIIFQ